MNLSPEWVRLLQAAGLEAVHWSSLGNAGDPDELLFEHAAREGFVIMTLDLDFSAILARTRRRAPSVIQIRADDVAPTRIGRVVVGALLQHQDTLLAGAIVSIDPGRARLRVLPLSPDL